MTMRSGGHERQGGAGGGLIAGSWWLDAKLGLRMLAKYPGLTLVGGFGIAVAVAIATAGFSVIYGAFLVSSIPLEEGDRIVSLEIWDSAASKPERRVRYDYQRWRTELKSVEGLSAFRTFTPNVIAAGTEAGSVRVTAMSAAGFRVARVRPLLGRHLVEEDEGEGAPPVVVIGERTWRNRFGGDRAILGRTLQIGATPHSIAGVMPEGFSFPVQDQFWVPLWGSSVAQEPLTGPELMVFGRLAAGATLESAQAELTSIGQRRVSEAPKLYGQLRPRVMPYAYPFAGLHEASDVSGILLMQGIIATLLVLVCLNVAILVYSRTATRQGEMAVRTALGASRSRIVAQLFVEALALAGLATVAGVGLAAVALRMIGNALVDVAGEMPFWVEFRLSPGAVVCAGVMSLAAATIVGIVPALMATRREVQTSLKAIGVGGSGLKLGKTWTLLIVAQVGFAVALLPGAVFGAWEAWRSSTAAPGFAAREYLAAELAVEGAGDYFQSRQVELMARLKGDARVAAVTYSMKNPGEEEAVLIRTESAVGGTEGGAGVEVRMNRVDVEFFRVFEAPILAGRGFQLADAGSNSSAVLVNRSLAERVFGGDALGRRVRYADKSGAMIEGGRWYEVVGIVSDFPTGASMGMNDSPNKMYHPAGPGQLQPVRLAVRLRGGDATGFAGRLRELAAEVDRGLQVRDVVSLEEALRREQWIRRWEAIVLGLVTVSVLLLSAAGIYALMSITVSQRRKEIGIRVALGADRNRIVGSIFARAVGQLVTGAALGMGAAAAAESGLGMMRGQAAVVLPVVALAMVGVGLGAAIGPARRILRIEPTEALREQ